MSLTESWKRPIGRNRKAEIDAFNAKNPVLKKGLAMMPVKFGISFNLTALNQAGSLVHVYQDGSVHLNHGGTEMGQGLYTKVAQVVAEVFGIGLVRCENHGDHNRESSQHIRNGSIIRF